MTKLLENVVTRLRSLPEERQDAIAAEIERLPALAQSEAPDASVGPVPGSPEAISLFLEWAKTRPKISGHADDSRESIY